ncbi:MAG TPA: DUF6600 domain-containing protein [Stellaceae bacterium]
MRFFLPSLLFSVVVSSTAALADQGAPPPDRVGRVSFADGKVSARAPGETQWSDAAEGEPVSAGTALRTGDEARAEIEIGADTIDFDNGAEARIALLDDRFAEIALTQGRIAIALRRLGTGESVEIDMPQGGVWLLQPGRYEIDVGDAGRAPRIAVFAGAARFAGGGTDLKIGAGAAVDPAAGATQEATEDAFADWCRGRDWDEANRAAPYYVSPEMTGSAELDDAGSWEWNLEYGAVWFPKDLPADWAPYRDGKWRWVAPWGWTWLDDRSWGFAPSHYGRWAMIGGRWGWVPGRFAAHPVYMPAVVAFLGTAGVGLSYAEGSGPAIGWFPLAPGEAYWPSYTADLDYIRRLNRGNVADPEAMHPAKDGKPPVELVGEIFADRLYASVVPRAVFTGGEATLPALLELPETRLQNAPVVTGSPAGAPPPPPPPHIAAAAPAPKPAHPAKPVHAAAAHPRREQSAAHGKGAHMRAPGYAAAPKSRHMVALRIAHPRPAAHKKDGKR